MPRSADVRDCVAGSHGQRLSYVHVLMAREVQINAMIVEEIFECRAEDSALSDVDSVVSRVHHFVPERDDPRHFCPLFKSACSFKISFKPSELLGDDCLLRRAVAGEPRVGVESDNVGVPHV